VGNIVFYMRSHESHLKQRTHECGQEVWVVRALDDVQAGSELLYCSEPVRRACRTQAQSGQLQTPLGAGQVEGLHQGARQPGRGRGGGGPIQKSFQSTHLHWRARGPAQSRDTAPD